MDLYLEIAQDLKERIKTVLCQWGYGQDVDYLIEEIGKAIDEALGLPGNQNGRRLKQ